MAFYWRGNQLFTKHGPTGEKDEGWTTFLMDLREPIEVNIYSRLLKIMYYIIIFIILTFVVPFLVAKY